MQKLVAGSQGKQNLLALGETQFNLQGSLRASFCSIIIQAIQGQQRKLQKEPANY